MAQRHLRSLAFVSAAALLSGGLAAAARQPASPPPYAFAGVNVVPMDRERVIENQTVLVQGGRIAQIGPEGSVTLPPGTQRIEARGKYLTPGLTDMHVHLPPGFDGAPGDPATVHMRLYLANGVTTIRGMVGHPSNLALRDRIVRGELQGPTIFAAGPALQAKAVPDAKSAEAVVVQQKQAGFDLLKVHQPLEPDTYEAIMAAAKKANMLVGGHVDPSVGLERALAARQGSIEHLDGYLQAMVPADSPVPPHPSQVVLGPVLKYTDEKRIPALAEATRKAGVYNTPTLTLFKIVVSPDAPETFLNWPEMQYVSPALRGQFAKQKAGIGAGNAPAEERQRYVDLRNRMVKALSDAGAPLMVGPDTPQLFLVPGFATHREIRSFVEAGLSPYASLLAATRTPAEYLRKQQEFGTVEVGKRADLLLLDGNPLQNIANLDKRAGVMLRGTWLPAGELQKMLADIAALYPAAAK